VRIFNCLICSSGAVRWKESFCKSCFKELCADLFPRSEATDSVENLSIYVAGDYQRSYASLIKKAKAQPFNLMSHEHRNFFEGLLDFWAAELKSLDFDAIVSAPGVELRGFLQSDLSAYVAVELSRRLKRPFYARVLVKNATFDFVGQKGRSRQERWKNFEVNPILTNAEELLRLRKEARRRILLVDDVCTSGATLHSCAQALRLQNLEVVAAFVLAKARLLAQSSKLRL